MASFSAIAAVADERLLLLQGIAELIATAKKLNLPDSVFLLKLAQLDLQTKVHSISDEEMHAFLNAVRLSVGITEGERDVRCPDGRI